MRLSSTASLIWSQILSRMPFRYRLGSEELLLHSCSPPLTLRAVSYCWNFLSKCGLSFSYFAIFLLLCYVWQVFIFCITIITHGYNYRRLRQGFAQKGGAIANRISEARGRDTGAHRKDRGRKSKPDFNDYK